MAIEKCGADGSLAVEEDVTHDLLLACSGLDLRHPALWSYRDRPPATPLGGGAGTPQSISNCSRGAAAGGWSCSRDFGPMILASINEHTRRSHVILPTVARGRFPDGDWFCRNGADTAVCSIDAICELFCLVFWCVFFIFV